jgi:hypothetical protein
MSRWLECWFTRHCRTREKQKTGNILTATNYRHAILETWVLLAAECLYSTKWYGVYKLTIVRYRRYGPRGSDRDIVSHHTLMQKYCITDDASSSQL